MCVWFFYQSQSTASEIFDVLVRIIFLFDDPNVFWRHAVLVPQLDSTHLAIAIVLECDHVLVDPQVVNFVGKCVDIGDHGNISQVRVLQQFLLVIRDRISQLAFQETERMVEIPVISFAVQVSLISMRLIQIKSKWRVTPQEEASIKFEAMLNRRRRFFCIRGLHKVPVDVGEHAAKLTHGDTPLLDMPATQFNIEVDI